MGATRALQGFQLLMYLERTGDDDNGHEWKQFPELGQKIETQLAIIQHMIEDHYCGWLFRNARQGLAAAFHAHQRKFRQSFLIDLILEIVVFDDENDRSIHKGLFDGSLSSTGRIRVNVLPWSSSETTAKPAPNFLASS